MEVIPLENNLPLVYVRVNPTTGDTNIIVSDPNIDWYYIDGEKKYD